jgi:hypothetical protein
VNKVETPDGRPSDVADIDALQIANGLAPQN